MLNEQRFFREFLQYVGHRVEIGLTTSSERVEGTVVNSMFDSVLLETVKGRKIVRFLDIEYLLPL